MFIFTLCTQSESQSSCCCAILSFFYELTCNAAGVFLHCSFFNLSLQNQKLFSGCTDDYHTLGKVSNTLKYLTEVLTTSFFCVFFITRLGVSF